MSNAAPLYEGVHLAAPLDAYMRVWMLGTGSPSLSVERQGISTLVQAGGRYLLFDVGRATLQRMYECAIPIPEVTDVFLTHLHSDHICGFPDFWMTGWFVLHRRRPLRVHGPVGTARFVAGLREMHHFDLAIRPRYETAAADGRDIEVVEYEAGTVLDQAGVRVEAFAVDHGPVRPSYGFVVTWNGRRLVLSGDTTLCDAVIERASGCDLLVHEIAAASARQYADNEITRRILAIHTSPEQMAEICRRARPRATVLNHVSVWRVSQYDLLAGVRTGHDVPVELGLDRMQVLVGPETRILPPGPPRMAQDLIVSDSAEENP